MIRSISWAAQRKLILWFLREKCQQQDRDSSSSEDTFIWLHHPPFSRASLQHTTTCCYSYYIHWDMNHQGTFILLCWISSLYSKWLEEFLLRKVWCNSPHKKGVLGCFCTYLNFWFAVIAKYKGRNYKCQTETDRDRKFNQRGFIQFYSRQQRLQIVRGGNTTKYLTLGENNREKLSKCLIVTFFNMLSFCCCIHQETQKQTGNLWKEK